MLTSTLTQAYMYKSVSILVAAEASVPGPTAGRAGLLAGQTQRDATAVNCLQVA